MSTISQASEATNERAASAKRRMLDVAISDVRERGLTVGFEWLQMDDIIFRAEVPRSSAYRLWESKQLFVADLLIELAEDSSRGLVEGETWRLCQQMIADNQDALGSEESRKALALEILRVAVEDNYYSVVDSTSWQTYVSICASLFGGPPSDKREQLKAALREGSDISMQRLADFHRWFTQRCGFRMKALYGDNFYLYAALCMGMVEGLGILHISNPQAVDRFFQGPRTLASQTAAKWSPAAIGLLSIFEQFMEPDPDFVA